MVGLPPTPQELRTLRKKANLTQKQLAARAGLSQALIARIEAGAVDPRVSTLKKILNVLNEVSSTKITAKNIMHQPIITIDIEDTIGKAIETLWKHGISQLPVMNGDRIVGSLKEETILRKMKDENVKDLLNTSVSSLIEESFPIVSIETDLDKVSRLLSAGSSAVLVSEHGLMVGIVTKIDLIAKHIM
jgi:predicted transcriptional regulator